jgi:glycosyltransferase involved in cell wall biosynthesis
VSRLSDLKHQLNILIFPEYSYPSNHVVVDTVYAQLLPARGHTVHMIRPAENLLDVEVRPAPWSKGSLRLFPFEPLGSASQNIRRRFRQMRCLRKILQDIESLPIDVVLVRNDLLCAREAISYCRRRNIPFVYQVSSPDAEFRIRQGRESGKVRGLYSIIRGKADLWTRRRVCRKADVVLPISDAMRDHMIEVEGLDSARVFSFPMGFNNLSVFANGKAATLRKQLCLPVSKTIVYTGVLDSVRDPNFMLDVLAKVGEKIPEAVLLVITQQTDDRRARFEQRAATRHLNVRVVGPLHHNEVITYLHAADVMISPCPPIFEYRISSPTKTLEGLGAGMPVVGNEEVEEHVRVLRDSGGGLAVPYNVSAFAEAVITILSSAAERARIGERGRTWVLNHRTYRHLTDYLDAILCNARSKSALAALPHSCN